MLWLREYGGAMARLHARCTGTRLLYAARTWIGRYPAVAAPFVVLTFNVWAPEPIRRAPGTAGTYVYTTCIGRLVATRELACG
jgi:hypothetical protein